MGHDEDKNNFDTGGTSTTPVTPNPRATITGSNRLGMRPSRNVSAAQAELDRISKESNPNAIPASDTGDIVLNNPAPKGKTPKIMIIGIVVIVVLVAVLVGLILTKQNASKGGTGDGESKGLEISTAKSSFNSFYNYLTAKNDSDSDIKEGTFTVDSYLELNQDMDGKSTYLDNLEAKADAFSEAYIKTVGGKKSEDVYAYYVSYYKLLDTISKLDYVSVYKQSGADVARNYVYETILPVKDGNKTNTILDNIIELERGFYDMQVSLLPAIERRGCILANNTINAKCSIVGEPEALAIQDQYIQTLSSINLQSSNLRSQASSSLSELYSEIYGININGTDTQ